MSVKPKIFRSQEQVAQIRAQKAKMAQQQQAMQTTMAGVQGAQVLSNTKVSGDNALGMMLGAQGGGGG